MEKKSHTVSELKEALYSLKNNKSAGYGSISYNAVTNCFGRCVTRYYIYLTYHLQVEYF